MRDVSFEESHRIIARRLDIEHQPCTGREQRIIEWRKRSLRCLGQIETQRGHRRVGVALSHLKTRQELEHGGFEPLAVEHCVDSRIGHRESSCARL